MAHAAHAEGEASPSADKPEGKGKGKVKSEGRSDRKVKSDPDAPDVRAVADLLADTAPPEHAPSIRTRHGRVQLAGAVARLTAAGWTPDAVAAEASAGSWRGVDYAPAVLAGRLRSADAADPPADPHLTAAANLGARWRGMVDRVDAEAEAARRWPEHPAARDCMLAAFDAPDPAEARSGPRAVSAFPPGSGTF